MKYLLDTNPCVLYLRKKNALVTLRIDSQVAGDIALCSVVVGELLFGAENSANPSKNLQDVEDFILPYPRLPFDDHAARIYAKIRLDLESRGMIIGDNDLLIAAIALFHNLTLVTHNTSEFSRVPGLMIEDWELP